MKRIITSMIVLCALWLAATPAAAQQTTGTITGRIVDDQGAAIPGVTVTAKNAATGFVRTERLGRRGHLPPQRAARRHVRPVDGPAGLRQGREQGHRGQRRPDARPQPDAQARDGAGDDHGQRGHAADPDHVRRRSAASSTCSRIESLPLNGRQFANAAITIPGVGLGFHSDPTKSTQYSPQIGGGNGRNVNYQIDGGDNNDDTVGGLLQLFPLEAIQEFNFVTQRYKAEYGRSNGGVMNIVTKSGTNDFHGSWFTNFRDTALNAKTKTEKINNLAQGRVRALPVRRLVRRPDHRRTRRTSSPPTSGRSRTRRSRSTRSGCSPTQDGVFPTPMPREPVHGQGLGQPDADAVPVGPLRPQHQLAGLRRHDAARVRQLGRQREHVQLVQHQPQLGPRRIEAERVRVPVRRLRATTSRRAPPTRSRRSRTASSSATTRTRRRRPSSGSTSSATTSRGRRPGMGGLGHAFKAGVNYIHEPRLYVTFSSGSTDYAIHAPRPRPRTARSAP